MLGRVPAAGYFPGGGQSSRLKRQRRLKEAEAL
jgi:hypothetical protein